MKKLCSTMLAVAMLLSMFVPQVMAEETTSAFKATGDYVLEVEAFDASHTHSNTLASDGKMFWHWGISPTGDETSYVITMPVTVTEAGTFKTAFAATTSGGNAYKSTVTIAVDGTEIGNTKTAGTEKIMDVNADFALYKYAGDDIYLDAGEHTVTVSVSKTADNYFKFAADYVSFTKLTAEDIAANISDPETATVKFVDYAKKYIGSYKDAEGNAIVGTSWGAKDEAYQLNIPVYASEAGMYDIAYLVSARPSGAWISDVTVSLDGVALGANSSTTGVESYKSTDGSLELTMRTYTKNAHYISEGEHTLTLEASLTGNGVVKFAADSVTFSKSDMSQVGVQISDPEKSTGKFVDYANQYTGKCTDEAGNPIVATGWGTEGEAYQISVPVYAAESGVYDIEYLISMKPSNAWISASTLMLDDMLIGSNSDNEGVAVYKVTADYNELTLKKYEKNGVFIKKGEHTVTLAVEMAPDNHVKFAADYVKFTKSSEDVVQLGNEAATVVANFDTPVTGLAVAALYSGNRFVGCGTVEVADVTHVEVEVATTAVADKAKLFILGDFAVLKPLANVKEITNIRCVPTTVHLFGDSVTVTYGEASYPLQGWGHYLPGLLTADATVANHAVGGTTAEVTYYEAWQANKDSVKPGDYVFIAFGLNDFYRAPKYDEVYKENETEEARIAVYKKYLGLLRDEAEAKGATVIFSTPTPENLVYRDDQHENWSARVDRLTRWAGYMKEVAAEKNNYCSDTNAVITKLFFYDEAQGVNTEEKAKDAYAKYYLSPEALEKFTEYTHTDDMKEKVATYADFTHVNEDGALLFAETILAEIAKTDCPFKAYIAK